MDSKMRRPRRTNNGGVYERSTTVKVTCAILCLTTLLIHHANGYTMNFDIGADEDDAQVDDLTESLVLSGLVSGGDFEDVSSLDDDLVTYSELEKKQSINMFEDFDGLNNVSGETLNELFGGNDNTFGSEEELLEKSSGDSSDFEMQGRIVGGSVVDEKGRYPYLASVLSSQKSHRGMQVWHTCGGSLIAPDVVLSAAHCAGPGAHFVQLGKHHVLSEMNEHLVETMKIIKQVKHPNWSQRTFENDLVLFKLSRKSENTPVKLQTNPDAMEDEEDMQVMGWGKTSSNGRLATLLKHATVSFMTNDECRSSKYGYGGIIKPTMMCAYADKQDACQGDSGGPMVRTHKNGNDPAQDVQAGVISWGFDCSHKYYPGVYARLDFGWVEKAICDPKDGLSPDSCDDQGRLPSPTVQYGSIASSGAARGNMHEPCTNMKGSLPTSQLMDMTCAQVAKFQWVLCHYHANECPEECCPSSCNEETGQCYNASERKRTFLR